MIFIKNIHFDISGDDTPNNIFDIEEKTLFFAISNYGNDQLRWMYYNDYYDIHCLAQPLTILRYDYTDIFLGWQ